MNRSVRYLLTLALLILGIPLISAAQPPDRFLGNAGPLEIYASNSLCCSPVHASILEEKPDPDSTVYYRFRNTGDKRVEGIAVTFSNSKWTRLHYSGFLTRSATLYDWIWQGFSGKAGADPAIEVDFVLFDDGTSWGPDRFGRGDILKSFKSGYDLAVDRVIKENDGKPNEKLDEVLKTRLGFHAAMDIPATGREPRISLTPFELGYDGVIRNLARGDKAAKALANKVRSMPIE